MAILTTLSENDLRAFCARYGKQLARFQGVAAGSVNTNYELWTDENEHLFARLYEEQDPAGAALETRRAARLRELAVPLPVALIDSEGRRVSQVAGKPAALFPFIQGQVRCQKSVSADDTRRVGAALGGVHRAFSGAPDAAALCGRSPFDLAAIGGRLDRLIPGELDDALRGARERLQGEATRLASSDFEAEELPLIHGDLFRDNVLFGAEGELWLLDFESASRGQASFDLAVTILAWCFGDDLDLELVHALVSGYQSVRPLLPAESRDLERAARLACLRFATTRITDYELRPAAAVVKKDYRRWLARLDTVLAMGNNLAKAFGT